MEMITIALLVDCIRKQTEETAVNALHMYPWQTLINRPEQLLVSLLSRHGVSRLRK